MIVLLYVVNSLNCFDNVKLNDYYFFIVNLIVVYTTIDAFIERLK